MNLKLENVKLEFHPFLIAIAHLLHKSKGKLRQYQSESTHSLCNKIYNDSTQDPYKDKSWAAVSILSKFPITIVSADVPTSSHVSLKTRLALE